MKAYWFSSHGVAQHGDFVPFLVGQTYNVEGEIHPCDNGLHASEHPSDALFYSIHDNTTLDLVELGGTIVGSNGDKHAASERTHIKRIDASNLLMEYARWCALSVVHFWECPDVVRKYLETGDESLRDEARDAAYAANGLLNSRSHAYAYYASGAAYQVAAYNPHNAAYYGARTAAKSTNNEIRNMQRAKFKELVDAAFAQGTP